MTNNRLRFDNFCRHLWDRWKNNNEFLLDSNPRSFCHHFSSYLVEVYGGHNGTNISLSEQRLHEEEGTTPMYEFEGGVVRHQPSWNRAVTEHAVFESVNQVHHLMNKFNDSHCAGERECLKLFKDLESRVLFLGPLTAVKLCYILGAVDRIIRQVLR